MNRKKLCYVMPEYNKESSSHFAYLADFLMEISENFDIFLIIERGEVPDEKFGASKVISAGSGFAFLRFIKIKLLLMRARFSGYRNFYIHYSFYSAFVASLLTKIFGGRVFYWNCGEPWKYQRSFFRDIFERLTYKLVDFLVTGTEGMKRQYSIHYNLSLNRIKVMPNWINLEKIKNLMPTGRHEKSKIKLGELRKELKISNDQKIILFIHRLSKRKGVHYLPEILKKLPITNSVLIIIGSGPERTEIEAKFKSFGIWDRVRFLGSVPNQQLADYYLNSDVFIMPSDEEGFPHVLLEAMAFGLPFVASDVGGVREIVPRLMYNYLVSSGDADNFTHKIFELFHKNEEIKTNLKADLSLWVQRFDIKKVKVKFAEIINDSGSQRNFF